jgi:hypothetical protein
MSAAIGRYPDSSWPRAIWPRCCFAVGRLMVLGSVTSTPFERVLARQREPDLPCAGCGDFGWCRGMRCSRFSARPGWARRNGLIIAVGRGAGRVGLAAAGSGDDRVHAQVGGQAGAGHAGDRGAAHQQVLDEPPGGLDDEFCRRLTAGPGRSGLQQAQAPVAIHVPGMLSALLNGGLRVDGPYCWCRHRERVPVSHKNAEVLPGQQRIQPRRCRAAERPGRASPAHDPAPLAVQIRPGATTRQQIAQM